MFEYQIALSDNNSKVAKSIFLDLKKAIEGVNVVLTSFSQDNKIFIVLAAEEIEKPRISFIISDVLSDAISSFYKLEFIQNNLKLPINNEVNLKAFKKALVAFDRETDKYIISRALKIEKGIYLDSFYQFRLKQLRTKWMEIIKLANDNASYLLCNDTFIDLLRFLIENIEISRGTINVIKKENEYKLCDEDFNEIDQNQCPLNQLEENEAGEEVNLITSLIALSPKKINVYCNSFENNSTLTLISQIFENRISILPAH